jgi:uncharacterized protein YchJ
MNARKLLVGLSLGLFCHIVQASEPIADLDKLEAGYIACIEDEKAFADRCLTGIFKPHALPWRKDVDLKTVEDFLSKWIGKDAIYKVHSITRKDAANLYQRRWYLIENESGGLVQLSVRFRTIKGQWYFVDMNLTNDEKAIGPLTLESTSPW